MKTANFNKRFIFQNANQQSQSQSKEISPELSAEQNLEDPAEQIKANQAKYTEEGAKKLEAAKSIAKHLEEAA